VDADRLRGCAVLLEVMVGPGVSSRRKSGAGESTCLEASLTLRLGLQVVATRRRVGKVLRGGSMEEEESQAVVLAGEPRRRQRVE
jgi:hypothetical protein